MDAYTSRPGLRARPGGLDDSGLAVFLAEYAAGMALLGPLVVAGLAASPVRREVVVGLAITFALMGTAAALAAVAARALEVLGRGTAARGPASVPEGRPSPRPVAPERAAPPDLDVAGRPRLRLLAPPPGEGGRAGRPRRRAPGGPGVARRGPRLGIVRGA